jgi:putative PIN family toxin of toxin-antitoxin system
VKIVLDTNVIISAIIGHDAAPRAILEACRRGELDLVLSKPQINEIGRVLHKPKLRTLHGMNDEDISQYLKFLGSLAELVPGTAPVEVSPDATDDYLFASAIEAKAAYLVSGDDKHVLVIKEYQGVQTISPTAFVTQNLSAKKAA